MNKFIHKFNNFRIEPPKVLVMKIGEIYCPYNRPFFIEKEYQRLISWPVEAQTLVHGLILNIYGAYEKTMSNKDTEIEGYRLNGGKISQINGGSYSLIDGSNRLNTVLCTLLALNQIRYCRGDINEISYRNNINNLMISDEVSSIFTIDTDFENMNYHELYEDLMGYDMNKSKSELKFDIDVDEMYNVKQNKKNLLKTLYELSRNIILAHDICHCKNIDDDSTKKLELFYDYIQKCVFIDFTEIAEEKKARAFEEENTRMNPLNLNERIKSCVRKYGNKENGIIDRFQTIYEAAQKTAYYIHTDKNNYFENVFYATLLCYKGYNQLRYCKLDDRVLLSKLTENNEPLSSVVKTHDFLDKMENIINYLNNFKEIDEFNLQFKSTKSGVPKSNTIPHYIFPVLFYLDNSIEDCDNKLQLKRCLYRLYWCTLNAAEFGTHKVTYYDNIFKFYNIIYGKTYVDIEKEIKPFFDKCFKVSGNILNEMYKSFVPKMSVTQNTQSIRNLCNLIECILCIEHKGTWSHTQHVDADKKVDIDHIFPKAHCINVNVSDAICNSVGNMTPLEKKLNQVKSSKVCLDYALQSDFFMTSGLHKNSVRNSDTNRFIIDLDREEPTKSFIEETIKKRGEFLAKKAFDWLFEF